jgi:uncharacterized membrane protein
MNKMNKNNDTNNQETSYTGLGVVWGASLGFIFGLLLFEDNFAVGIGIGLAIGIVIGSILDSRRANGFDENRESNKTKQ